MENDSAIAEEEERRARFRAQKEDAHRALGRYVVEFSLLVKSMRDAMTQRLYRPGDPQLLVELAFGDATARPICDAFFGMCRIATELDADEQRILSTLKTLVEDAITERNTLAHGDWWIGYASVDASDMDDPFVVRIKPGRVAGPLSYVSRPVAELDAMSDRLLELRRLVVPFGDVCFGAHPRQVLDGQETRVKDHFVRKGNRVVREGPHASGIHFPDG